MLILRAAGTVYPHRVTAIAWQTTTVIQQSRRWIQP